MELLSFTFLVVLSTTIATLFYSGWLIIASDDTKDLKRGVKWMVVCVYSLLVLTIVLKIIK